MKKPPIRPTKTRQEYAKAAAERIRKLPNGSMQQKKEKLKSPSWRAPAPRLSKQRKSKD